MKIFIKTIPDSGTAAPYEVDPFETIANLKDKIQAKEGIAPEEQRLVYDGKYLKDGCLLDYNVQKDSILHLILPLREDIRVHVIYRAETITIMAEPDDTMDDVREKIGPMVDKNIKLYRPHWRMVKSLKPVETDWNASDHVSDNGETTIYVTGRNYWSFIQVVAKVAGTFEKCLGRGDNKQRNMPKCDLVQEKY